MKIAIFTEGLIKRIRGGGHLAARDQFPKFIGHLAEHFSSLSIASRCDTHNKDESGLDLLEESVYKFFELPYYENTEDFFRRRRQIERQALPIIRSLVASSDVVMLRIPHPMAKTILSLAEATGCKVVAYWAGPPLRETVKVNYPGNSLRHRLARFVAASRCRLHKRIAGAVDWNFVIDPQEYGEIGSPAHAQWVVPSLVDEIDIAVEPRRRPPGEPLRLCFAGRITRHKGVFDLLASLREAVDSGLSILLDVAGQGPDQSEFIQEVERYRLGNAVTFHGPLPQAELSQLLAVCHVFVLPSYGEGMPKAIWEAWAAGLALITAPVGAIPVHVRDEDNGLLVKPGDRRALLEALAVLHNDESLRYELARKGLVSVRDHTWTEEISKIAWRIKMVVGGGHPEMIVADSGK